jgi:hypothetical protein
MVGFHVRKGADSRGSSAGHLVMILAAKREPDSNESMKHKHHYQRGPVVGLVQITKKQ